MLTVDEVIAKLRAKAEILGRTPTREEMREEGVNERDVERCGGYREACRAADLKPDTSRLKIEVPDLFNAWGELVRRLGGIPTIRQNRREGEFSVQSYERNVGPWATIPDAFRIFAADKGEWQDVLALLPATKPATTESKKLQRPYQGDSATHPKLAGRRTYADPLDFRGLRHEPRCENGVIFLFGMIARELGFLVETVEPGFPDCDAKWQYAPGKWKRVTIEFEFESYEYRKHLHEPEQADFIVCWRHNWPACPQEITVLELRERIKTLPKSED